MDIYSMNDYTVFNELSLTKKVIYTDEHVLTFVLNFMPGQTLPSHQHMNSTVVLTCLKGRGTIKINQEERELKEGSILFARGQDYFAIPQVKEALSLFVTISPNPSNPIYSKSVD